MSLLSSEKEVFTSEEMSFFQAGEELEKEERVNDFSDLDEKRPTFWSRVFRSTPELK